LQQVKDIEGHSRSSELSLFDMPYTSHQWSIVTTSCPVSEILPHRKCMWLLVILSILKTDEITSHVRFPIHV